MNASRVDGVKAPQHLKTPSFHLLLRLVPFFLMFRGPFGLELLNMLEVLLHVRQNFFFFNNTSYFLLLFALDALDAFPFYFYGRGLLFRGFFQRPLLARTQAAGPVMRRTFPHQICLLYTSPSPRD